MAALNEHSGPNFVEELTEDNVCSICTGLLKDPVLTDCCGQHFCDQCFESWLPEQPAVGTCPHCKAQDFKYIKSLPKKKQIDVLKIYCPNHSMGCKKITTVGECSTHLETCLFEEVSCTNDCGVRMLRNDLQIHITYECPKRKVNCQYCNQEGMYEEITAKYHLSWCPSLPLDCPNDCGPDKIQCKDLSDHQKECPLEPVKCPFFEAGCKQEMPRKELAAHKASNTENHLELTMMNTQRQLETMKTDVQNTKDKLKRTRDELKEFSFKFDGLASCVTEHLATIDTNPKNRTAINHITSALEAMTSFLEEDKQYCLPMVSTAEIYQQTPSFYIQNGYKLHIKESGKLYLEKTDYDDVLTWPMDPIDIELNTTDNMHIRTVKICNKCGTTVNRVQDGQTETEVEEQTNNYFLERSILLTVKKHHC